METQIDVAWRYSDRFPVASGISRDTAYGMMNLSWQRSDDTLTVEITLPVGTTATYKLPKGTTEVVVDDIKTPTTTDSIDLVSGTTRIVYKI